MEGKGRGFLHSKEWAMRSISALLRRTGDLGYSHLCSEMHWDTTAVELLSQDNPKTSAFPSSGHGYQCEPLSWRHTWSTRDAWRHLEIHSTPVAQEKRSIFKEGVGHLVHLDKYKMGRRTGEP